MQPRPKSAARARRANLRAPRAERVLASYRVIDGGERELVSFSGAAQSVLVVDRARSGRSLPRLVAHLAADEPAENAMLVCEDYLARMRVGECRCRELTSDDRSLPPALEQAVAESPLELVGVAHARALEGETFVLRARSASATLPQLRWWRVGSLAGGDGAPEQECAAAPATRASARPVSLREAVGALQSYEPLRSITSRAITRARRRTDLSTTMLRAELARVELSPIILNRALRERVLAAVARGDLSMSEIAIRCGRVKRDSRGNESGETSWLARRLGLLPEGGQAAPTPWVHSEVLALIARRGLGVAPREVEL